MIFVFWRPPGLGGAFFARAGAWGWGHLGLERPLDWGGFGWGGLFARFRRGRPRVGSDLGLGALVFGRAGAEGQASRLETSCGNWALETMSEGLCKILRNRPRP